MKISIIIYTFYGVMVLSCCCGHIRGCGCGCGCCDCNHCGCFTLQSDFWLGSIWDTPLKST